MAGEQDSWNGRPASQKRKNKLTGGNGTVGYPEEIEDIVERTLAVPLDVRVCPPK